MNTTPSELSAKDTLYTLTIMFIDQIDGNERYVRLGGAAWPTRKTQMRHWNAIAPAGVKTSFILDRLDDERCIEADKYITAETVEALLDEPIATLIERGRRATAFRYAPLKN
jgi:hypothetical protein